ncbi:Hint domain-containing protein [Tateyamaria sp. ANG-S1]|uniref:Hint domain-containing protein n=1 Tax=Tateyamaria sp. ANG-S1 TaxID=1577905 RepID=UPI00068A3C38|nr:Hint domain-containing protein [Tateyamaria sp. ANG-S1]
MASFTFNLPIYAFDQWSADADTNSTTSYPIGASFTLNPGAELTVIEIEDDDGNPLGSDDNLFSDGFLDTPGDGSSPSTASNDQALTEEVEINDAEFGEGSQVELEFAFTTTTGETFWVIRIDGQNVGISGPSLPVPGTTYEVASNSDGQETPVNDIPCFIDGAMVETPDGPVPIEHLAAGDLVITVDNGPQPIVWVGARPVSDLEVMFFPELHPIEFAAGAMGPGQPAQSLVLSPNHRVLFNGVAADLFFGESEVLVAAKHMQNGTTIAPVRNVTPICYRHILLERHEILIVNGLPCESLCPRIGTYDVEQRLDFELFGRAGVDADTFARPVLRKFEAALLT